MRFFTITSIGIIFLGIFAFAVNPKTENRYERCRLPLLKLSEGNPRQIGIVLLSSDFDSIKPAFKLTHVARMPSGSEEFSKVEKIINYANKRFQIRGWSQNFLKERLKLAKQFSDRSDYLYVTDPKAPNTLIGSIGLTVSSSIDELLPMELSHGWKLPRPGNGPVIELRTFAMDKVPGNPDGVFPGIFAWTLNEVNKELAEMPPSLMREKILYTYGDKVSVHLYGKMGFEVASDIPSVVHEGTEWKVLTISPERLAENYRRFSAKGVRIYSQSPKSELQVIWANGEKIPVTNVYFGMNGPFSNFQLGKDLEIWKGAKVKAGEYIQFHEDTGTLQGIGAGFENDVEVAPGLIAKAHTSVAWTKDGDVWTATLSKPATFDGGRMQALEGSRIASDHNYVFVEKMGNDLEVLPGIYSKAGDFLKKRLEKDGRFGLYFKVRDKTEFAPGVWAEAGAYVAIQIIDPHKYHLDKIGRGNDDQKIGVDVFVKEDLSSFMEVKKR